MSIEVGCVGEKCEQNINSKNSEVASNSLLERRKCMLSRNKIFVVPNEYPNRLLSRISLKLNNSTTNSSIKRHFSPTTRNLESARTLSTSSSVDSNTTLNLLRKNRKQENSNYPTKALQSENISTQRKFLTVKPIERELVVNKGVDSVDLWDCPPHYCTGTIKRRPLKLTSSTFKANENPTVFPQEKYSLTTNNQHFPVSQKIPSSSNCSCSVNKQLATKFKPSANNQEMGNAIYCKDKPTQGSSTICKYNDTQSGKNIKPEKEKQNSTPLEADFSLVDKAFGTFSKGKRKMVLKQDRKKSSKYSQNSIFNTNDEIDMKSLTSSCQNEKTLEIFHGQTDSDNKVVVVEIGDSYHSDSCTLTSTFHEKREEKKTFLRQHLDPYAENEEKLEKSSNCLKKIITLNSVDRIHPKNRELKHTTSLPDMSLELDVGLIDTRDSFRRSLISSSSFHCHSAQSDEQLYITPHAHFNKEENHENPSVAANEIIIASNNSVKSNFYSEMLLLNIKESPQVATNFNLSNTHLFNSKCAKDSKKQMQSISECCLTNSEKDGNASKIPRHLDLPHVNTSQALIFHSKILSFDADTKFLNSTRKIYTDWANHYLEKAKCKRGIQDLQVDVTDGVILAEVIEAVTNQKIPDIIRKPKNASQMLDNIQSCLTFLSGIGVSLEGINGRDIRDGHLKSILSLFFQLSRYKQQQKQQDRDRHILLKQSSDNMQGAGVKSFGYKYPQTDLSRVSSPIISKNNMGSSNIPMPGSIASTPSNNAPSTLNQKKIPSNVYTSDSKLSKINGQAIGSNMLHYNGSGSGKPASGSSSRSTSPSAVTGIPQSFIPTPRTSKPTAPSSSRSSIHEKSICNVKLPNGQAQHEKQSNRIQSANNIVTPNGNNAVNAKTNSSMLEKFKFFKEKDKGDKVKGSKRTSSSSGFSSARSERSDSSTSLYTDTKGNAIEGIYVRENGSSNLSGSKTLIQEVDSTIDHSDAVNRCNGQSSRVVSSTPKLGIKGFKQKLGKAISIKDSKNSHGSPKLQKKEVLTSNEQLNQKLPSTKSTPNKIQSQSGKSDLILTSQQPENLSKKTALPYNGSERQVNGIKSDSSKLRTPSRTTDTASICEQNNAHSGNASFLRQPKPTSSSNRDSRNRFSGTGIPTRNSIISPNSHSSSRDELSSQPDLLSTTNANTMISEGASVCTGIPKPTAAVRGTSKAFNNNSSKDVIPTPPEPSNTNIKKSALLTKSGLQLKPIHRTIPKCTAIEGESEGTLGNNKNENISVAMVSPMPVPLHQSFNPQTVVTSLSSNDSSLTQSNNSNSSESSIIALGIKSDSHSKVENSDTGYNKHVDIMENGNGESMLNEKPCNAKLNAYLSNKATDDVIVECDEDELMVNVTPMEPLEPIMRNSPYGYMKSPPGSGFLSPRSTGSNSGNQIGRLGLEIRGTNTGNRQLFSPSNYSDPGRVINRNHNTSSRKYGVSTQYTSNMGDYDYPDIESLDATATGYLSDGDLLSTNNGNRTMDGYLSETSTGNYIRKLGQCSKNKDGNIVAKNMKNNKITEDRNSIGALGPELYETSQTNSDSSKLTNVTVVEKGIVRRFDDSSSLSSGISDLNEFPTDLTSSSVNSELSSPYASLQKLGDSNSRKNRESIDPQSIIYRVVGCRGGSNRRPVDSSDSRKEDSFDLRNSKHGPQKDKTDSFANLRRTSDLKGNNGQSVSFSHLNINNGANTLSHPPLQPGKSGKYMNTTETNKKQPAMGMRNEYCGRDEKGVKEDGKLRGYNGQISEMSLKQSTSQSQSTPSVKSLEGNGSPISFGYIRRSTGSGGGGGGNGVSMTKYTIPVSGNAKGHDEYKVAAHISLMPKNQYGLNCGDMQHGIHYIPTSCSPNSSGAHNTKARTKVKVSGGTQTTSDLHEINRAQQYHNNYSQPHPSNPQRHNSTTDVEYASSTCSRNSATYSAPYKSLSLTAPTAAQLSQSLRERILGSNSLPKGTTSAEYSAMMAAMHQQQQHLQIYGTPNASKERMARYNKFIMHDGTLSENGGYANYADLQPYGNMNSASSPGNAPYPWIRHSTGYASSITSAPTRLGNGGSMTEAESMESLSSSSSYAAQIRDARSNNLVSAKGPNSIVQQSGDGSPSRSPRLNRSNSISHFRERTFPRSTKSEKLYPSMLQRSEEASPYYAATVSSGADTSLQSPMQGINNRSGVNLPGSYTATLASSHSGRLSMSPYSGYLTKLIPKEDEINGSALSLVSTASSIYNSQEEKHSYELRKLKRELMENQEKIQTLTNQLSTNAHVVAAFEQSLANMTHRLQNLTATAEQKDSELVELRRTIELLRRQGIEAGIALGNTKSELSRDNSPIARHLSADSVSSINSISSACSGTSHSHSHLSSPATHVQSVSAGSPHRHNTLPTPDSPNSKKKNTKNKGWLRSSFTKAFTRSKSKTRNGSGIDGNCDDMCSRPSLNINDFGHTISNGNHEISEPKDFEPYGPTSPILASPHGCSSSSGHGSGNGCGSSTGSHSPRSNGIIKGSNSASALAEESHPVKPKSVDDLKKKLREKEMVLTDIRLEALTSAHQLESLKETVNKMRNEMLSLKQDNERLQRMVTCRSLNSSQTSLQTNGVDSIDRRLSANEIAPPNVVDSMLMDPSEKGGKRVIVTVFLGSHGCYERYLKPGDSFPVSECAIGTVNISNRIKWDLLDSFVKRTFKDYVMRVDPVSNLGLSADSITCYNVGEVVRSKEADLPDLLPCGYLVGDVNKIRICLKGALTSSSLDALAFETLISKSVLQRYISLLSDYGRLILCGPSGSGKSYLARKLGEYLVAKAGVDPSPEAIATFSVDHKNSKELRQYLSNLAEQCENGSVDLPSVIILDNLHQVSSFGEVFNGFLNSNSTSVRPIIIGTMTQSSSSVVNLQLHHSFRWVLLSNNSEPTKGLLGRYLNRRLIESDVQNGSKNIELARIMEWIPETYSHINRFLEKYNAPEVTIGPKLFLFCPTDASSSQIWFNDLWHYKIVPYLIEAVKEGLQLYGKKGQWEDPAEFIIQTYPWAEFNKLTSNTSPVLRIRPEDVGYDSNPGSNGSAKLFKTDETDGSDPLLNMLMRLQEAANFSSGMDSDSTSLDSHLSKDFTATA